MEGMAQRWSVGSSDTLRASVMAAREAEQAAKRGHVVVCHTLRCPVQGAWAVREHRCQWGVFWEEEQGRLTRWWFDHRGVRRKGPEVDEISTKKGGFVEIVPLFPSHWARDVAKEAAFGLRLRRVTVAVEGAEPGREALRAVLQAAGCRVEERWRAGIPGFWMERGGFRLMARDERGALVDSGQLLAVVTLIEMEQGGGVVALPPWSSAACALVAAGYRGTVLRLDRDGDRARDVYAALPWLREAPSAAARICTRMAASGQSLMGLVEKTPRFHQWTREAAVPWDRGQVLDSLGPRGHLQPEGRGIQLHAGQCWLHVRPLEGRRVQVMAEGPDLEMAEELCDWCVRALDKADK